MVDPGIDEQFGKEVRNKSASEQLSKSVSYRKFVCIPYVDISHFQHLSVSKNRDTPKSSFLIGFSIINHPFWGSPIFGNTHLNSRSRPLQVDSSEDLLRLTTQPLSSSHAETAETPLSGVENLCVASRRQGYHPQLLGFC